MKSTESALPLLDLTQPDRASERTSTLQNQAEKEVGAILTRLDAQQSADETYSAEPTVDTRETTSHQHNTIGIFGPRGIGKTSFLLSMLKKHGTLNVDQELDEKQLYISLGVIDPTLLSGKSNVFLLVLDRIQSAMRKQSTSSEKAEAWEKAFEGLAAGIHALEEVGPSPLANDAWDDSVFVSNQGLQKVHDSASLERNYHTFLRRSIECFPGKKAFILGFDDIDTSFERGWPILESIRRYFTSPHLIVLLSGDLELYQPLIRKHQWINLGKELIENDKKGNDYRSMVQKLEEQYLMKILKPENRVYLVPPIKFLKDKKTDLYIDEYIKVNDSESLKVQAAFDRLLSGGFNLQKGRDRSLVERAILKDTTRSLVQIFKAYFQSAEPDRVEDVWKLADSLISIASSGISALEISPGQLHDDSVERFLVVMGYQMVLKAARDSEKAGDEASAFLIGRDFYQLAPSSGDYSQNMALVAIALKGAALLNESPGSILDYYLRVGLSWETVFVPILGVDKKAAGNPKSFPSYAQLDQERALRSVGNYHAAFVRGSEGPTSQHTVLRGTIALYSAKVRHVRKSLFDGKDKTKENAFPGYSKFLEEVYRTNPLPPLLDANSHASIQTKIRSWHRRLIPRISCRILWPNGATVGAVSVFSLINSLSRLFDKQSDAINAEILDEEEVRTYPVPSMEGINDFDGDKDGDGDDQEFEDEESTADQGDENSGDFPDILRRWVESYRKPGKLIHPIYLTNRIWQRCYYNLISIGDAAESATNPNLKCCGELFERMIIAFLNATLAEETQYFRSDIKVVRSNPVANDVIFLGNLDRWLRAVPPIDREQWHFWNLWTCPIWGHFLRPELKNKDKNGRELGDSAFSLWKKHCEEKWEATTWLEVTYTPRHSTSSPGDVKISNMYTVLNSLGVRRK